MVTQALPALILDLFHRFVSAKCSVKLYAVLGHMKPNVSSFSGVNTGSLAPESPGHPHFTGLGALPAMLLVI